MNVKPRLTNPFLSPGDAGFAVFVILHLRLSAPGRERGPGCISHTDAWLTTCQVSYTKPPTYLQWNLCLGLLWRASCSKRLSTITSMCFRNGPSDFFTPGVKLLPDTRTDVLKATVRDPFLAVFLFVTRFQAQRGSSFSTGVFFLVRLVQGSCMTLGIDFAQVQAGNGCDFWWIGAVRRCPWSLAPINSRFGRRWDSLLRADCVPCFVF